MKALKSIMTLLLAIVFIAFMGYEFGQILHCSPLIPAGILLVAALIPIMPTAACAGVYPEIWTGELIKKFRETATFLSTIARRDDLVKSDAIHLVDVGADPDVLVNNITYPINIVSRVDEDISVSLDKFDTENTPVTDDELHGISYDKIGSVIEQHNLVLTEYTSTKALHSLAPTNISAGPIIETTGAVNSDTSRRRMITTDIINLKKKFDDLKIPKQGRILVLCNDHIADLLLTDEYFQNQYKMIPEGKLLPLLYGFQIHEYTDSPIYKNNGGAFVKNAWGAAKDPANDRLASIAFYAPRALQCMGSVKMFYRDASIDPEFRRNVVGFKLYHLCLPKKNIGFGAIVSAISSES